LAGERVRDRLHARAAHADAGADRVDARIERLHGDLGALAGIAGAALDLDQALADLGHLDLEQLDQELRGRAADEQLRAARLGAYILEPAAQPVAGAHRLARDHLFPRHQRFHVAAEIQEYIAALDALDDAGQQLALPMLVGVDDLGALGLAHFLDDHLLGGLRRDPAELDRFHRLLDGVAHLHVRLLGTRLRQPDLLPRQLELGVVVDHMPDPESRCLAGPAVDAHARIDFIPMPLSGRRRQRRFDGLENDALVHALLIGHGFHNQQDLFAHFPVSTRGVSQASSSRLALSIWLSGTLISTPFSSITT